MGSKTNKYKLGWLLILGAILFTQAACSVHTALEKNPINVVLQPSLGVRPAPPLTLQVSKPSSANKPHFFESPTSDIDEIRIITTKTYQSFLVNPDLSTLKEVGFPLSIKDPIVIKKYMLIVKQELFNLNHQESNYFANSDAVMRQPHPTSVARSGVFFIKKNKVKEYFLFGASLDRCRIINSPHNEYPDLDGYYMADDNLDDGQHFPAEQLFYATFNFLLQQHIEFSQLHCN